LLIHFSKEQEIFLLVLFHSSNIFIPSSETLSAMLLSLSENMKHGGAGIRKRAAFGGKQTKEMLYVSQALIKVTLI
jgi:hypothetical protein